MSQQDIDEQDHELKTQSLFDIYVADSEKVEKVIEFDADLIADIFTDNRFDKLEIGFQLSALIERKITELADQDAFNKELVA